MDEPLFAGRTDEEVVDMLDPGAKGDGIADSRAEHLQKSAAEVAPQDTHREKEVRRGHAASGDHQQRRLRRE